ncbi:MAG: hypothetical protein RLP02_40600 [Coleofasciculus sp. C2-GNP5-27]
MTYCKLSHNQSQRGDKLSLKLRYKTFKSGTEDKFEAWITQIEDEWNDEIAACLQGQFPDWRS